MFTCAPAAPNTHTLVAVAFMHDHYTNTHYTNIYSTALNSCLQVVYAMCRSFSSHWLRATLTDCLDAEEQKKWTVSPDALSHWGAFCVPVYEFKSNIYSPSGLASTKSRGRFGLLFGAMWGVYGESELILMTIRNLLLLDTTWMNSEWTGR